MCFLSSLASFQVRTSLNSRAHTTESDRSSVISEASIRVIEISSYYSCAKNTNEHTITIPVNYRWWIVS